MTSPKNGGRFTEWMGNGAVATVVWFVVLVAYCTFRAIGVEDPIIGQAFLLVTGAYVGVLTLAQNRKQQRETERVEQKVNNLQKVALEKHPDVAGDLDDDHG